jgi:hypothetical protein
MVAQIVTILFVFILGIMLAAIEDCEGWDT